MDIRGKHTISRLQFLKRSFEMQQKAHQEHITLSTHRNGTIISIISGYYHANNRTK